LPANLAACSSIDRSKRSRSEASFSCSATSAVNQGRLLAAAELYFNDRRVL
jgi:hypothetical protein